MVEGVRLSQSLPHYDVISTLGVLRDLPETVADLYAVLEMVANSEKPLVLLVSDESLFPTVLVILGSLPMFFEMKHVVDFYDPQSFLINLACAEMMAHYRVPLSGPLPRRGEG